MKHKTQKNLSQKWIHLRNLRLIWVHKGWESVWMRAKLLFSFILTEKPIELWGGGLEKEVISYKNQNTSKL